MSVRVTDNSAKVMDRYRDASFKAMDAVANHLRVSVVKAFGSWYYKGGKFRSTLYVKQRIYHQTPYRTADGWESQVGTPVVQALYWELGHMNAFTRKYERVQIFVPTAAAEVQRMKDTFARVVARFMKAPI